MDNFRQAVESPESWNSISYICLKSTFLYLKHYLQIYITLLSTDFWFRKWHEEYDKFPPEHLKVSKLGFWWNPLIQSWKSMRLNSTEELSVMAMKNDTKFQEELTCHFKLTWGNWRILTRALESLKKFPFNELLLSKVYIFWAKKSTEELSFMKLHRNTKFGEESTCRFKIGIRNFTKFDPSTQKSQKFTF